MNWTTFVVMAQDNMPVLLLAFLNVGCFWVLDLVFRQ